VALEVDRIVTIYKQEQFHATPSLNSQLAGRKDTLDRLIDFVGREGTNEHVLVVNSDNLVRNHLAVHAETETPSVQDNNGNDTTTPIEKAR
jgi:purine-binding chemotaxis protein CheW